MTLGQANQILVSRALGAGDTKEAERLVRRTFFASVGCNLTLSLLSVVFAGPIFRLFTDSEEIISLCSKAMLIDIAIELGRGVNHSINNGLRGAGYLKWPVIEACSSNIIIGGAFAWLLCAHFGLGVFGIWIALAADELFRGTMAATFWKAGGWKKIDLVGRNQKKKDAEQA